MSPRLLLALLLYVARHPLSDRISQLGPRTLVGHLRESDIDGAPMLFQAASSSSVKCLRRVSKVIEETLGSSELREQLQAKDLKGRTITFHAATSKNVEVFHEIITMLAKEDPCGSWIVVESNGCALETALDEEGGIAPRIVHKHRSDSVAIADKTVLVDYKGMNLLHHASRYGSAGLLELVVERARQYGSMFLRGYLHSVDGKGRTPLICLLRQETKRRDNEISKKLKLLLDNMAASSTSTSEYGDSPSACDNLLVYMTKSQSTKYDGTVLTHAAHGGPKQFELARETICRLAGNRCHSDGGIDLDIALGLEEGGPQWAESEGPELSEKRKKRHGILLEEAASGGHVSVLEDVVSAIKVESNTFFEGVGGTLDFNREPSKLSWSAPLLSPRALQESCVTVLRLAHVCPVLQHVVVHSNSRCNRSQKPSPDLSRAHADRPFVTLSYLQSLQSGT